MPAAAVSGVILSLPAGSPRSLERPAPRRPERKKDTPSFLTEPYPRVKCLHLAIDVRGSVVYTCDTTPGVPEKVLYYI